MCWQSIKDEFHFRKLLLGHNRPEVFAQPLVSQCVNYVIDAEFILMFMLDRICSFCLQHHTPSIVFVVYRVVMALYFLSMQVYLFTEWNAQSLIFFTNWSYMILVVGASVQGIVAVMHYIRYKTTQKGN